MSRLKAPSHTVRRLALLSALLLALPLTLPLGALTTGCGDDSGAGEGHDASVPDAQNQVVAVPFEDPGLEQCVRDALGGGPGDIYATFVEPMEHLACQDRGIQSLAGIEYMPNLKDLTLFENQIEDLTPLAGLTKLESLQLSGNRIWDLTPLAGMTHLRRLGLQDNEIRTLEPLADLTGLEWLTLDNNIISTTELTHLDAMTSLRWLTLEGNPITSLQALDNLPAPGLEYYAPWGVQRTLSPALARLPERARGFLPNTLRGVALPHVTMPRPSPLPWEDPEWESKQVGLDPYALASPNQQDAGSCLFMAITGAMEILLNQHADLADVDYLGDTDLSERYLMDAYGYAPREARPYFPTDVLFAYNELGGSLLSREYPFTLGYIKDGPGGDPVAADSSDPDAQFSAKYNWIDELPSGWQQNLTPTPLATRTLISIDPAQDEYSVWRVGLMNDDVVARVKWELRTKNAPVVIIFNYYGWWHTVLIIGYDDSLASRGCPLVTDSIAHFRDNDAAETADKLEARMAEQGGCSDHGVFYVRDSIYPGNDEPIFDYGGAYSDRYSDRVITYSYNWVKYLANHVYTVNRLTER